jgi:hypothetical protein
MIDDEIQTKETPGPPCPDCGTEMEPIKLIDQARGWETELHYAAGEARKSWWTGAFPHAGLVRARLCPACGQIRLHAVPFPIK